MPAHGSINRLRRNEHDRRYLTISHLFQRDLMRDEHLLYIQTQTAEDQRPRIGCGSALGVEIHFLAGEILQALYLRPNEDMQFRREEIEQVGDATPDLRYLNLVLFERVGIDDRRIDAAQVQQRIQIFRGASGDDRQDVQIGPIVDNPGHLGGKANRRTLKQAAGETDRKRDRTKPIVDHDAAGVNDAEDRVCRAADARERREDGRRRLSHPKVGRRRWALLRRTPWPSSNAATRR